MNNSSIACKGRTQKASKVRKNGQIFGPKMFGFTLYLRNAAPSTPIKRGSNGPVYEMGKKDKRKGRKEREKGEKKGD